MSFFFGRRGTEPRIGIMRSPYSVPCQFIIGLLCLAVIGNIMVMPIIMAITHNGKNTINIENACNARRPWSPWQGCGSRRTRAAPPAAHTAALVTRAAPVLPWQGCGSRRTWPAARAAHSDLMVSDHPFRNNATSILASCSLRLRG